MGPLKEGHHPNKGRPKVKQLLKLVRVTMFNLKFLPIAKKKTFVIES
jgi:hypothetical protein